MNNIANIIDQHRVGSTSFGTFFGRGGRKIQCQCGWVAVAYYDEQTSPIDGENNPEREAERRHAEHVSGVLQDVQRVQGPTTECVSRLGASGLTFRAIERTTATKYQIQAFEREYPEQVVADLLRRAAYEIGKHEEIPTQIKIDRAPVTGGEKITVTWFA